MVFSTRDHHYYVDTSANATYIIIPVTSLTHQLQLIIRRPPSLGETQASLDALQEFPRRLVAHNVCSILVALVQFFACGSLVNTNHSNSNRPCSVEHVSLVLIIRPSGWTYALPILSLRYASLACT